MKKVLKTLMIVIGMITIIVLEIDLYVRFSTGSQMVKATEYTKLDDIDCIIILGAGVWEINLVQC